MPPVSNAIGETTSIYKTQFYSDCSGVFECGGCRASAFAGAYEAVYSLGVRFSEVAGTSAGAIVAALIAAGAEHDYLLKELRKLDFRAFLSVPRRPLFPSRSMGLAAPTKASRAREGWGLYQAL